MQIHEITHQPVNEVLGTMAAGVGKALANKFVSSQLPGVSLYGDDDDDKTTKQQLPPVPPYTPPYKPPAPNLGQQQSGYASVNTNAPTGATLPASQSWQGTNINVPAAQRKQAASAATPVATAPTATPATAPAAPVATAPATAPSVTPRPGYRIMVQVPAGGKYYKTDKGWTNEVGQAITKPASVAALEKRADSAGREERITKPQPPRLPGKPMRTRRTR